MESSVIKSSSPTKDILLEHGRPMTVTDVAQIFSVSPNTIRKYYSTFGGVELPSGKYRFFENRIRKFIDGEKCANENNPEQWEAEVACGRSCEGGSERKAIRTNTGGAAASSEMGAADTGNVSDQEGDRHGIFD